MQEDAAPRNLNDSCGERCWLCPGVCSCMVQARFNAQLPFSSGGSKILPRPRLVLAVFGLNSLVLSVSARCEPAHRWLVCRLVVS